MFRRVDLPARFLETLLHSMPGRYEAIEACGIR